MRALYKLHIQCGRQGALEGLFITEVKEMNKLVKSGKEVPFGEVLGKHSDVYCPITKEDYTLVTKDEGVIELVEKHGLETGFNPFDYLEE